LTVRRGGNKREAKAGGKTRKHVNSKNGTEGSGAKLTGVGVLVKASPKNRRGGKKKKTVMVGREIK